MQRINSLLDVASIFRPGRRIVLHSACASPPRLSAQLVELASLQEPLDIFDLTTIEEPAYVPGVASGVLRLSTFVPGRAVRRYLRSGTVSVHRRPLSQAPTCFATGEIRADILLLHLSTPDALGLMSLGVSCDTMRAALERDPVVIAEVNPDMPATAGETAVRPEDVDYWIEGRGPPITVEQPAGDAKDSAIADNVAGLIRSGDILQTGIGTIADLTAARLSHLSALGVHTGIITEALQPLIERGVITNAGKDEFRGKSVATLAAGSASFYRFLHQNPDIVFLPCDRTHDRARLARLSRLTAINGALEIDLSGRINSEAAGGQPISGPGGQPDFSAGAASAPDGKSIIALRATSKDGQTSRIVGNLAPADPVTIDCRHVDYVVTEHGVARVTGLTGSDVARALIAVAAPEFRADLLNS